MDLGLANKIALITGSSKGLGFATAEVLLEEGAKVMINSRYQDNIDTAIDELLGNKKYRKLRVGSDDETNEETCHTIVEKTVGALAD